MLLDVLGLCQALGPARLKRSAYKWMAVYRQLTLCRRIKGLRESSGYSQAFVASKLGISQAAYSRLESGEIEMAVSKVMSIADLYNVPLDILLAGV